MLNTELRRTLFTPYWCEGNPLDCKWKDTLGPSGVLLSKDNASFPSVGLFNLLWLSLDNPEYGKNRKEEDRNTMLYVIQNLQHEKAGEHFILELASRYPLDKFMREIEPYQFDGKPAVVRYYNNKTAQA